MKNKGGDDDDATSTDVYVPTNNEYKSAAVWGRSWGVVTRVAQRVSGGSACGDVSFQK